MTAPPTAETIVRDLLDLAVDAANLADDLVSAGEALRDWYAGDRVDVEAKAAALALLRSAREGLAELIAETERA